MAKQVFSDKDIKKLKANPYTYSVTPNRLQFTAEFKEIFWEKYCSGKSPTVIVYELGYDPEILGTSRIEGILQRIRHEACSDVGFHTGYARNRKSPQSTHVSTYPSDQSVARLQNEVLYLRQELEFLKKIIKSDSDGKRRK